MVFLPQAEEFQLLYNLFLEISFSSLFNPLSALHIKIRIKKCRVTLFQELIGDDKRFGSGCTGEPVGMAGGLAPPAAWGAGNREVP